MRVKISSAIRLSLEQQTALTHKLGQIFGAEIKLSFATDPNLIGGLRIVTPGSTLDLSLQAKLNDLKQQLMS